jgi:sugar lactone lactonase YvrE
MQTTLNRFVGPVKRAAAGTWLTVFSVLILGLIAIPAKLAAQQPIVVSGPATQVGNLGGDGWDAGQNPIGGTFAVGANGNVIVGNGYGATVEEIIPSQYASSPANESALATFSGNYNAGAAAAMDVYGNIYIAPSAFYGGVPTIYLFKLPYDAATGTYAGFTSSTVPTNVCNNGGSQVAENTDTAACIFAPQIQAAVATNTGYLQAGFADIAFDAQGDLFFSTDTVSGANSVNTIYECNLVCLNNTTNGTATQIYAEPANSNMGAMAIDPWGNLFFIDGNSSANAASHLKEIPLVSGSYSSSNIVTLETYTTIPGFNSISGLAIAANGTVYFSTDDGVFAMPNTLTNGPSASAVYMVSNVSGRGITLDPNGNLYMVDDHNNIQFVPVNSVSLGAEPAGTAAAAVSATIFDSSASCSPTESVAVKHFGVTSTDFTATAGTTCSAGFSGANGTFSSGPLSASSFSSSYSLTLNFTPSAVGERNAALTITNSASGASGVSQLTGVGQGAMANVDPGAITSYTAGLSGPASVVADPAGDLFVADSTAGKVFEFPTGSTSTTTPTVIGSGFTSPAALAFDANGDLFVADGSANDVVEIPNIGTTGAFAAGTKQTILSASTTFDGTALQSPAALAVGPNGALYISDAGNKRVVSYNPITGQGGVTLATSTINQGSSSPIGLENPQGLAVDSSGNLYIADESQNLIFVVSSAGIVSIVTPASSVKNAKGVAVDASGSLSVSDNSSSNIVRIPNVSGTLTPSQAVTIETISPQASSLWMDSMGDLYVASAGGISANAILRNQTSGASINLGTVADNATNTGNVYLESSGNEALTLAATDVTQPSNSPLFQLNAASTNSCQSGAQTSGSWCAFSALFEPTTQTGSLSGTAEIVLSTPSISIPVTISGTASVSALVPQVIVITPTPPTTGYVGQQVALSATATSASPAVNSGLPVTVTSATPSTCTVTVISSGATTSFTVNLIATGSCTVDANQAGGNANSAVYGTAPTVPIDIAISNIITTAGVPALVVNQATWIGDFGPSYSGGFTSGPNPAGGSFAVNSLGDVIDGNSYGKNIQIWTPSSNGYPLTYTQIDIPMPSGSNVAGASVDAQNNIYAANLYYHQLWKVPFVSGAYATTVPSSVPNCVGSGGSTPDSTFCAFTISGFANGESEVYATAFDTNGNMFLVSELSATGQNGIYEIPAASLASISGGTIAMTPIYTTDPNSIASIAFDANDNLFFTDIQYGATSGGTPVNAGQSQTYASNLFELANTGTAASPAYSTVAPGQAGGPVLLQSFVNASSQIHTYDNAMSGVAADRTKGLVYFSTISDGIWAFADNGTPFSSTSLPSFYAVAGSNGTSFDATDMTGGKGLAVGAPGSLYAVGADSSSDDLYMLTIGNLATPIAQFDGTAVTSSAAVVDNALAWCPSPAATLAFTFTGADASDFAATQGTGCSAVAGGGGYDGSFTNAIGVASSYPATITFTPLLPNAQTVTMDLSDTTNGGEGTATVSGNAETTPQTISFTAPTVTTYTYTAPPSPVTITLTVANGPSNLPVTFTAACPTGASACGAGSFAGGNTTVTESASGNSTSATFTVTQAGAIQISAVEEGSTVGGLVGGVYYSGSNTATLTLTISPASQTITFTPVSPSTYTYSASPQVIIPLSATGGVSGNPVEFTVDKSSTGAGTITSSTTVGSASLATLTVTQAGSIVIDASQAATANYAAASVPDAQTLTINQAAQTITFVPPTQPIYFIAASSGVTGGITVQVSAVGGGSDNPIVFTVDPKSTLQGSFGTSTVSGATSTATLTIPVQSGGATSGSIVVDATQAQSTNYAAVTVSPLGTITILPPLPTQLITFNNPGTQVVGTALKLSATASSGLPISYASTTSSVCTVSGAAITFSSSVTAATTCTIVASQPGDNINWAAAPSVSQSFTVNPQGQNPSVNLSFTLSALTIQSGTVGLTQLTISSQDNFTGALSMACSGLPSGYSCSFNPSLITSIAEGGTATTTLTITPPASAALDRRGRSPFLPTTALAAVLCFLGFRKRRRLQLLLIAFVSLAALGVLSGCGGSASSTPTTSTTSTATITVSASGLAGASGTVQQTATLTVTVE